MVLRVFVIIIVILTFFFFFMFLSSFSTYIVQVKTVCKDKDRTIDRRVRDRV